ncbi:MAG: TetR/AcrR family transcriptional regulator [Hyphomonas sp.]|uniref:TetR/AcrR family transcriptional regulator n=1 Tax=Hyphomonas sp. TaxID=87 RepID=UPI001823454C|nr:helix-turn-helix domain-containing protein [Hyphomonas sp.]MBA3067585.1 TetR/AcrR family transcriptional regulator [Hyphomonas sp.]MBU3920702.1 TetR/AcrR family transcriptional regulator [Alphaproteobacteria bacterium]MBU4063475.1 TetR/AcrR family transcriptional regulator [Alphaproteobacteria bacterium]MBU4165296.1 TetR/AcrR family transcriptional regulator [Alphaproteobacteria bacterium]
MAPRQRHRAPVIDAAVRLFRQQGYAATGLNDLVDASGAPKGSLYHYFPEGKPSIAAAAVEEAGRRVVQTVETLVRKSNSTSELLREHARLLAGWLEKSGYRDGCPITTVILELAPTDRRVTEAARKAYSSRQALIEAKLVEDGFSRAEASRLAVLCISALQGSLIQARVDRSRKPVEATAGELGRLIELARLSRRA